MLEARPEVEALTPYAGPDFRHYEPRAHQQGMVIVALLRLQPQQSDGDDAGPAGHLLVWPPGDCARVVAVRERGVLVRRMAGWPVIDGSFRLTLGTRDDMRRFITAFAASTD